MIMMISIHHTHECDGGDDDDDALNIDLRQIRSFFLALCVLFHHGQVVMIIIEYNDDADLQ